MFLIKPRGSKKCVQVVEIAIAVVVVLFVMFFGWFFVSLFIESYKSGKLS